VSINRFSSLRFADLCDGIRRGAGRSRPSVVLRPYGSLVELRGALDAAAGARLHAILALASDFTGHLPSLISLPSPAANLVLTAAGGDFPLLPSWSFAADGAAHGWRKITFDPDWAAAVTHAVATAPADARVEIYWPAWRPLDEVGFAEASASPVAQHRVSRDGTLRTCHHSA
jgi:hypothetical protein